MSSLLLESFSNDERVYSFDTERSAWERVSSPKPGEGGRVGTSGFADERRVGLVRWQKLFVAVFVLGDSVQVQLDRTRVELRRDNIATRRRWLAPCAKHFALRDGARELFSASYWWADVHEWPDDEILDIFLYIDRLLRTTQQVKGFLSFWSLKAAGLNTLEAARERDALNHRADVPAA